MEVYCTIPCTARQHVWALRLGDSVRGLCTDVVNWNVVTEVASISAWDLPGTIVHSGHEVWEWPDDLTPLAGQCGHVFQRTSQSKGCHVISYPQPVEPLVINLGGSSGSAAAYAATSGVLGRSGLSAALAWILCGVAAAAAPSSADATTPISGVRFDSTQTCNVGWCHELACQSTHFATSTGRLAEYFRSHSPFKKVRVQLWQPFQGPATFDIARDAPAADLENTLVALGHDSSTRLLHVAFDSQATTIDLISAPYGHSAWWIVRDGLSRELLRPVAPWYEDGSHSIVTLNHLGQASTVIYSPEVARLRRLPQGARGVTADPLTRVIGHLTWDGLVLTEVAIATVTGAALGVRSGFFRSVVLAIWLVSGVSAMQAPPHDALALSVTNQPAGWQGNNPSSPSCMRIWTYTLAAPVTVPYDPAPDPNRMAQIVASTHRGVPACGDFIWTSPQLVQGTAHILHFPPGAAPPATFWLLHYCARAVVVGVYPGPLDWSRLGQQAQDAFGAECFGRGQFGVQYSARTFVFGQHLQAPPHGAILHIVKLLPAPSANSNAWDSAPDPPPIRTFDYDICMGPHGEVPIVRGVGDAMRRSTSNSQPIQRNPPPDRAPDLISLTRQIESVASGLQTLNTRLEDAGVFRVAPSTAQETNEAPLAESTAPDQSSAVRPSAARFLFLSSLWSLSYNRWAVIASVPFLFPLCSGDGVSEESDDTPAGSPEPEPPSEPDLTDVSAPTPRNVVSRLSNIEAYVRPSDDDLARTSAPRIGSDNVEGPVFQATEIPAIQRRVLAMLSEVDVERPPVPFIPAGCPIVIHNPFTSRSQAQHLTGIVGTPQIFRDLLLDYTVRRGWQPLVGVTPQPDDRAIHLIPAAAENSLVSVVFRHGDQLHPRCLARTMPAADYHSIRLAGRRGRIRLPYHTRRNADQPLYFRDGECLHADTGPWGPPPPTPAVHSGVAGSGTTNPFAVILALSCLQPYRGAAVLSILLVGASAMMPTASITSALSGTVNPSLYPWRQPASRALLSAVADGDPVRCVLACPWTGPQGAFQGGPDLTVEAVHFRFAAALLADTSLMPVWPGPHPYQLTFVPHLASSSLICALLHYEGTLRSIVLPRRIDYSDLICAVRFHLGQDVNQVRLPPAIHAKRIHAPDRPVSLRDGDLLDVLASRPSRRETVRHGRFLKDKVLWTRDFDVGEDIAVRLWMPHVQGPLFTWLEAGSRWDACDLTFTGSFRDRYPGCWVPAPWSPGQSPHFVQVPAEPRRVSVLHNSSDGVAGLQVIPNIATSELAELLHTLPSQLSVLSYPQANVDTVMSLRDGDILWDAMNYADSLCEWPHINDVVSRALGLRSVLV